ncbi:MAG: DNA-3-methyladenine glycosylase 2 family protein [Bacteroidota bacterium]|nr:DNA-3-methyladenine glycosylase 2 family protein [Bacteroidota bacterium]
MHDTFHKDNFYSICNKLAKKDKHLRLIIRQFGYPPMWTRTGSFQTLIHIILEQQVSLASAKAAMNKLQIQIGIITPKKLLVLNNAEMRSCYFSRQKTIYARHLAEAIISKQLNLKKLTNYGDDEVRNELKRIKGIGDWTADVYLLFALQRTDVFPIGDLAMINALKEVKQLPEQILKEKFLEVAEQWRPYRSIAAMILWHYYIQKRGIKF